MARPPGSGKCVHCLGQFDIRNWDHVFPRSWYPDSTPSNMEKWQIPTCKKCNSDYGKLEEELFVLLAMATDPSHPGASGVYKRALRSIDESLGRGKRDRLARRAKKKRVYDSLLRGDQIPGHGIYPGLGERWGRIRGDQIAFPVPANHLRRFCEKIVRGISYREDRLFIEPPFLIEFYPLHDDDAKPIRGVLDRHGVIYKRGPGFEVVRVVPSDEPRAAIYKITLFGQVIMYAFVSRPDG